MDMPLFRPRFDDDDDDDDDDVWLSLLTSHRSKNTMNPFTAKDITFTQLQLVSR